MSRTLGGMEIFGEISAGGMGSVLLARKTGAHGFEKIVAVKTIRADLADREDIRRLFLDEARLAARIEHPAVTQVYEFGEDDGTLFLAMEYIQGVSLEALLEKLGPIPAGFAARIGAVVCRGLHAAHETSGADGKLLGVVHRDVSPANVMLTFDGGVKILDFGIALMRDRRAPDTQVGRLRGKLAYMAPEQVAGGKVDRRTDVYGVANVLFEITTGRKLRGDLQQHEVAATFDRPLPRASECGVPKILDAIIAQGLERDPNLRFLDARSMAIALEAASAELGGESLEELAHRTLAEEHAAHKKQLAQLIGGAVVSGKKVRGPTLVANSATPLPAIAESCASLPPLAIAESRADLSRPRSELAPLIIGAAIALVVVGAALLAPSEDAASRWSIEGDAPMRVAEEIAAPTAQRESPDREAAEPESRARESLGTESAAREAAEREASQHSKRSRPKRAIEEKREIGYLTVGAHPYAVVVVDGREQGLTPLLKIPLETGAHHIVLLDPASRAVRASESIEIRANLLTNRLYR